MKVTTIQQYTIATFQIGIEQVHTTFIGEVTREEFIGTQLEKDVVFEARLEYKNLPWNTNMLEPKEIFIKPIKTSQNAKNGLVIILK